MNETWLNIGTKHAARLVVKHIGGGRGVGLGRLLVQAEITPTEALAEDCTLWIGGRVETVGVIGGADAAVHLAPLQAEARPVFLPKLGGHTQVAFFADLDDRQLQIIESHRRGGVMLRFWLSAGAFRDGTHEWVHINNLDYTVSQSDWITLLEQFGFTRLFLIELEVPGMESSPALRETIDYFGEARRNYMIGQNRAAVESLRQCLAALVGKKVDDEDDNGDLGAATKALSKESRTTQVGYPRRFELVRQSLKFLCDLGAHPEADETLRQHAHAALIMVAGLLEGLQVRAR